MPHKFEREHEREMIDTYLQRKGAQRFALGQETSPRSHKSRLLWERHERVRREYRALITHGFCKREIAALMQVSTAQVRKIANKLALIWELKGYGL